MIVTQQHIEAFRRDGVVLLKGVLDSKVVESGRLAVEEAIAHPGPQAEFIRANSTWTSVSNDFGAPKTPGIKNDDWVMFQDQFSSTRCPRMARFVREESNVGGIAAELMQSKTATFFYDHVICKRPNVNSQQEQDESTSIPWHQDLPYWNVNGSQIASVWIPFDTMPEDSTDGVTWIIGSHCWGLFRPRHFVDSSPYEGTEHLPDMPSVDDWVASGKAHSKTFAVQPGDVLVFDARIIHCSGTNMDQTPHRRVALRFGGDDAVYFERTGETAIPTPDIHHGLSHGDPLASIRTAVQVLPVSSQFVPAETSTCQFVPASSSSQVPEAAGIFDDASEEKFLPQSGENEEAVRPEYDDEVEDDDDKILGRNDDDEWAPPKRAGKKRKRTKKKEEEIKSNVLPKQPRGYCSICGRRNFATSTEAARHEAECDVIGNSNGPWKCRICGKSNFQNSAAIAGHWRCCNKGSTVTQASLSLEPAALESERDKLSDFNRLIVKSIELFEASATDVEIQHLGNGYRKIELGNVGIRCRHCAQLGVLTIGSISYTNDLKHLPHNMYTMVVRHLLESCQNVREDLKHQLLQAKTSSTSQSLRKGALGLPAYLRLLIDHYDLTDVGKREGIRRKSVGGDHGK